MLRKESRTLAKVITCDIWGLGILKSASPEGLDIDLEGDRQTEGYTRILLLDGSFKNV
jgi:hypothetical protein